MYKLIIAVFIWSSVTQVQLIETMDKSKAVAQGISQFTINLYNAVREEVGPSSNIFISPYSISAVVAMVLAGAKGDTKRQILDALNLSEKSDEDILTGFSALIGKTEGQDPANKLNTANRVYAMENYKILESYSTLLEKYFGATLELKNFGDDKTRIDINKWVEEQTESKIKDLIPQGALDAMTRLVLVNAIYFKGMWQNAFDPKETVKEPFHLSKTDTTDVQMMHIEETFRVGENKELGVRTLEMPYKGRLLTILIVLPNEIDGLSALEEKLKDNPLAWKQMEQLMRPSKLKVSLPKFKIESSVELSKIMAKMGMSDLFDESKANLAGISEKNDLFASAVFHKAFIDVNEEGTEAAAATGIKIEKKSATILVEVSPFIADRPFFYYIRDVQSDAILFTGSFNRPQI
ncbi:ipis-1-like isoform X2 [Artemia franciscana]|uniref:Serpin domain-containing protein n=1 Tax=Artemia franciscana TaxID=6661 RepID=A0AA88HQP2_ARTSF|nr:hypothetical protein QYM36_012618 [Artemia franciscana]